MPTPIIGSLVCHLVLIAGAILGLRAGSDDGPALAPAAARIPVAPAGCVERRRDIEPTMRHEDPAIQQALLLLGQAVNPIRIAGPVEIREMYSRAPGALAPPPGLDAFRAPGDPSDPNIYVNEASAVYTSAVRKPSALVLLKLAATLVHEQVHNTDGELAAYRLQSDFVRSRLTSVPSRQQDEAHAYAEALNARAFARQFGIERPACVLRVP